jgi:hypothetical protein
MGTTEYCKLKEETLARTVWGTRFGRVYGARHKTDKLTVAITKRALPKRNAYVHLFHVM